jgi:hypothetical protein
LNRKPIGSISWPVQTPDCITSLLVALEQMEAHGGETREFETKSFLNDQNE